MSLSDGPIEGLLRSLSGDRFTLPPAVPRLTTMLQGTNATLWRLEDAARAADTDAQLGRLKRQIDEQNAQRAGCVSQIDELLAAAVPAAAGLAPLSCSVGTALDRLTVAVLRAGFLVAAEDPRAMAAHEQLDDLCAATVADWAELREGRRCLPQPGVLKRYTGPDGRGRPFVSAGSQARSRSR